MGCLALFFAFCFPPETDALVPGPTTDARRILLSHNETFLEAEIEPSPLILSLWNESSLDSSLFGKSSSTWAFLLMFISLCAPLIQPIVDRCCPRQAGSGPEELPENRLLFQLLRNSVFRWWFVEGGYAGDVDFVPGEDAENRWCSRLYFFVGSLTLSSVAGCLVDVGSRLLDVGKHLFDVGKLWR